jgi:hypothetical protein
MPIDLTIKGKQKTYKKFNSAVTAVAKAKGISKERAAAYVSTVDRKQNKKK